MKRATSSAPTADGDRPRPTRREIELMLLAYAASGQTFALRNERDGVAMLTLGQRTVGDVAALVSS